MAQKVPQGKPLKRFVSERAQALWEFTELSDDVSDNTIEAIQSIKRLGLLTMNREDYPSLPAPPSFSIWPPTAVYPSRPSTAKMGSPRT